MWFGRWLRSERSETEESAREGEKEDETRREDEREREFVRWRSRWDRRSKSLCSLGEDVSEREIEEKETDEVVERGKNKLADSSNSNDGSLPSSIDKTGDDKEDCSTS